MFRARRAEHTYRSAEVTRCALRAPQFCGGMGRSISIVKPKAEPGLVSRRCYLPAHQPSDVAANVHAAYPSNVLVRPSFGPRRGAIPHHC